MIEPSVNKGAYAGLGEQVLKHHLQTQGFSLFAWQDQPGVHYNPHSHSHDEYIVVYKGCITFKIDGINHRLEPGDLLNLPAHTVHEAVNDGTSPVKYFICTKS